jgi:hypothetical protein
MDGESEKKQRTWLRWIPVVLRPGAAQQRSLWTPVLELAQDGLAWGDSIGAKNSVGSRETSRTGVNTSRTGMTKVMT